VSSTLLFYGPGARSKALYEAQSTGRLLAPPFGDEGLTIHPRTKDNQVYQGTLEALRLLRTIPVGDRLGFVILGPMDQANIESSDSLLKTVEEPHELVRAILWAHDSSGVSPTIRSRCLPVWCPAVETEEDVEMESDGRAAVEAALQGHLWELPPLVEKHKKKLHDFMGVVASGISASGTPEAMAMWSRIRKVAKWHNPTELEVLAALLPEV